MHLYVKRALLVQQVDNLCDAFVPDHIPRVVRVRAARVVGGDERARLPNAVGQDLLARSRGEDKRGVPKWDECTRGLLNARAHALGVKDEACVA